MADFLGDMARSSNRRVKALIGRRAEIEAACATAVPATSLALSDEGFDVIAEAKLASPAEGVLADGGLEKVQSLAVAYSGAGAAALSVLTEPETFGGAPDHLRRVAATVSIPVMRKDFLVDPLQVVEARALGASGVLLIARILDPTTIVDMTDLAIELGMFVLVELFDDTDVTSARFVFDRPVMLGVNARDLESLRIDPGRHEALAPHLPKDHLLVAESGLSTPGDIESIARLGYSLALVGSSLVKSADPARLLENLLSAGRKAAVGARA